jgi:hypothetical protein
MTATDRTGRCYCPQQYNPDWTLSTPWLMQPRTERCYHPPADNTSHSGMLWLCTNQLFRVIYRPAIKSTKLKYINWHHPLHRQEAEVTTIYHVESWRFHMYVCRNWITFAYFYFNHFLYCDVKRNEGSVQAKSITHTSDAPQKSSEVWYLISPWWPNLHPSLILYLTSLNIFCYDFFSNR